MFLEPAVHLMAGALWVRSPWFLGPKFFLPKFPTFALPMQNYAIPLIF